MRNYAEIGCLTLLGVTLTVYIAKCNHQTQRDISVPKRVCVDAPRNILSIIQSEERDTEQPSGYLVVSSSLKFDAPVSSSFASTTVGLFEGLSLSFDSGWRVAVFSFPVRRVDLSPLTQQHSFDFIFKGYQALTFYDPLLHQRASFFSVPFVSLYSPLTCETRAGPVLFS